ncbi:ribosome recycling factor [Tichowtungia aerotolerans]|uniref:Ribosome-recycling factor n=1 Tax=Tichowtungia aerotolerans TaxID=2697043 RepID=A0A6P1M249_9BACT|nr:ribosome recycling factor [Tichowtungia aerotolerans]QHI67921.1 ribosome recycling factor [Tichowtungia aerotolerans]
MESSTEVLLAAEDKMNKCVEFLQQELAGLRTGKASPSLVENITVDYYGSASRLRDIANISTPEPRLIVISPFDPSSLGTIEKAIIAANIGITPMNDGRLIRVPIPELSEERRKDLVKVAGRTTEEQRVAVRNVRREANDLLKSLEKNSKISEDDRDESLEEVQKLTDTHIKKMDQMLSAKETEVMAV